MNFDTIDSSGCEWVISLVRPSTNSELSVYAPKDFGMIMQLVSIDPSSEVTTKAFDAIAQWAENNFPQWEIKNIVPDYKVEL
jgi:hypothetical protein